MGQITRKKIEVTSTVDPPAYYSKTISSDPLHRSLYYSVSMCFSDGCDSAAAQTSVVNVADKV